MTRIQTNEQMVKNKGDIMNNLKIKTEPAKKVRASEITTCCFEIDDDDFETEKDTDTHTDMINHYESMGYTMIEDWTDYKKTLMGLEVPGIGTLYVTIKNAVPTMGNKM